jgi:hypothetical protein
MTPVLKRILIVGTALLVLMLGARMCVSTEASGPQPTRGVRP